MNPLKSFFKTTACIILLIIHLPVFAQQPANNSSFNALLNDYYEEGLKFNPLAATQRGDNRYNDLLLNDISVPHLQKVHDFNLKYQNKLDAYKRQDLNSFDKVSFDIMSLQIKQAVEREKFHFEYMPFTQFDGLPGTLPSLGSGKDIQPFKTIKDYNNWLKRVNGFADWADTAIADFNKGIAAGKVLPRALVEKMIPQLEAQTVNDTSKNLFYGPLKMMPASFSEKEKANFRLKFQKMITEKIIPAYKKLADYLSLVYMSAARTTSGYNSIAEGAAMYQFSVKQYTTTDMSIKEIYSIGINEADRITKEIEILKNKIRFKQGIPELFIYTQTDKQFFPFTTDEQVLDSFRAILPRIEPNLKKLFNIVPKSKFEVRAIEKFKVASSAANYQRGAEDGSRPGYFNVPVINAENYNKLGMENLFLHEAIPGHHFQLSLQQENTSFPKIRKFASYSAFSEGWALYTESLGEELGLYTDPYQKLAAYKSELFRAIRLVTDIGLHTGTMTREESIKYMVGKGGREERGAVSETERYMARPGQALSYKIGELKIKALKARYQKSLGDKFSIKKFHDALLLVGSVPLSVLETYMDEWANNQRK